MIMKGIKKCMQRLLRRLFRKKPRGIYYINGPDVLPPPLSLEEEHLAIETCHNNDGARDRLIAHNLRLVVYIA